MRKGGSHNRKAQGWTMKLWHALNRKDESGETLCEAIWQFTCGLVALALMAYAMNESSLEVIYEHNPQTHSAGKRDSLVPAHCCVEMARSALHDEPYLF